MTSPLLTRLPSEIYPRIHARLHLIPKLHVSLPMRLRSFQAASRNHTSLPTKKSEITSIAVRTLVSYILATRYKVEAKP